MRVLVINCGSSSIKYQVLDMPAERVLSKGLIANINPRGPVRDYEQGLDAVFKSLDDQGLVPDAIGHRVVHGGPHFDAPALISEAVRKAIARHAVLAPLHNAPNLAGIEAAQRRAPGVPQVAVFDTAFHRGMPSVACTYALPMQLAREHGFRRYGFHGTNCSWCLSAAAAHLGRPPDRLNLIVAHLGAGASVTAIRHGRSVDTSMGVSPLEGLMMQTRCGNIDPAIVLSMLRSRMSIDDLDRLLNERSGVRGICGEADMLTVARRSAAGDSYARFAREMYAYRVAHYVGAYAGLAWPLDALIFTAGIGENDAELRTAVCERLPQLGLRLDSALNSGTADTSRDIGDARSATRILVVPANEELQIARETVACIGAHRAAS